MKLSESKKKNAVKHNINSLYEAINGYELQL